MFVVSGVTAIQAVLMSLAMLQLVGKSESKRCLKREEIGNRVNNHYRCDHPVYSVCCERHQRFTCCEPSWSKNLREQLQLWGMLGMLVVVGASLCTCLLKDSDCIRSDTLRQALCSFTRKFRKRGKQKERKTKEGRMEEGRMQDSDTALLTRNMAPLTTSTTSFTNTCQQL